MYFLVCLLILVIIIKFLNVKESFNGQCVITFEPYLNSLLNQEDITGLYERHITKNNRKHGGRFKGYIDHRIINDKKDYNKTINYFNKINNIDIDEINPEAHTKNCLDFLEMI
jgi:hypothetical protein